jgi:uncharacterized integral membrane protein
MDTLCAVSSGRNVIYRKSHCNLSLSLSLVMILVLLTAINILRTTYSTSLSFEFHRFHSPV